MAVPLVTITHAANVEYISIWETRNKRRFKTKSVKSNRASNNAFSCKRENTTKRKLKIAKAVNKVRKEFTRILIKRKYDFTN